MSEEGLSDVGNSYEISVFNTKGENLNITLHWESNIWEFANAFKTVLGWIGFHPDTIKECVRTEYDQIEEEEAKATTS